MIGVLALYAPTQQFPNQHFRPSALRGQQIATIAVLEINALACVWRVLGLSGYVPPTRGISQAQRAGFEAALAFGAAFA
jgi:hypothetical protein